MSKSDIIDMLNTSRRQYACPNCEGDGCDICNQSGLINAWDNPNLAFSAHLRDQCYSITDGE